MSIPTRLQELLDGSSVHYQHHVHTKTNTAVETAQAVHIPSDEMIKSVIVNADGQLRMAVLPANTKVDIGSIQFSTRTVNIRLATESELQKAFPDCEIGAMPPFGPLFGVPVFCDTRVEFHEFVEFNAGTHTDTVRMEYPDFKKLANPTMIDLVDHHTVHAA